MVISVIHNHRMARFFQFPHYHQGVVDLGGIAKPTRTWTQDQIAYRLECWILGHSTPHTCPLFKRRANSPALPCDHRLGNLSELILRLLGNAFLRVETGLLQVRPHLRHFPAVFRSATLYFIQEIVEGYCDVIRPPQSLFIQTVNLELRIHRLPCWAGRTATAATTRL